MKFKKIMKISHFPYFFSLMTKKYWRIKIKKKVSIHIITVNFLNGDILTYFFGCGIDFELFLAKSWVFDHWAEKIRGFVFINDNMNDCNMPHVVLNDNNFHHNKFKNHHILFLWKKLFFTKYLKMTFSSYIICLHQSVTKQLRSLLKADKYCGFVRLTAVQELVYFLLSPFLLEYLQTFWYYYGVGLKEKENRPYMLDNLFLTKRTVGIRGW